ncbi:MAG: hypothetical protein KGJ59_07500 [Bacteroidota bacterium]|nr:hypothetical protein [Bacteroidota bacterium]
MQGFEVSPQWNEQIKTFTFDPVKHPFGKVRIQINVPAKEKLDSLKSTLLIFYALPNGNTIEQTVGRQMAEGVDWHFNIQHIGAQVRKLREIMPEENIIIAYLEAEGKSWPAWRRKFPDNSKLILHIIDTVRNEFQEFRPRVVLSAHSGGGSFIFGFLNGVDSIPDWIERISFLDANYSYDDSLYHGDKFLAWLNADAAHHLSVIAYDDRNITFNGKCVVGPDGGTFRATHRMLQRFKKNIQFTFHQDSTIQQYAGVNKQIEFLIHTNPTNSILHTILVQRNGFLHAMTFGTPVEPDAGVFFGEPAYSKWIQP